MKRNDEDLRYVYRVGKMTILEIMAVLAVTGLLATWVLHKFFS